MYSATKLCCLCVRNDKMTENVHNVDLDSIKIMDKLIFCIPELTYNISNHLVYICAMCHDYLNLFYKFKNTCMKNYKEFLDFITEMEKSSTNENVFKNLTINVPECSNLQTKSSSEKDIKIIPQSNYIPEVIPQSNYIPEIIPQSNYIPEIISIKEEKHDYDSTADEKVIMDIQTDEEEETEDNDYSANEQSSNSADVAKVNDHLLPQKSKKLYDAEYTKFENWMEANSLDAINEAALLRYHEQLSGTFSPNSLWTKFSMLKKTILLRENIDLAKFHNLSEALKQSLKGYESKKTKVLTREEILKFLNEAPNKTFLMIKVALLFGIFGGCRREELVHMLTDHVEDRKSVLVVRIPRAEKRRVFTIIDDKEMNSLQIIKKYMALRPKNCPERRFFLNYRSGRCTVQPVGKNTFGKIPSAIAKYLNLEEPDKYSGHCLRKTFEILQENPSLKKRRRWKSKNVAKNNNSETFDSEASTSASTSMMYESFDNYTFNLNE